MCHFFLIPLIIPYFFAQKIYAAVITLPHRCASTYSGCILNLFHRLFNLSGLILRSSANPAQAVQQRQRLAVAAVSAQQLQGFPSQAVVSVVFYLFNCRLRMLGQQQADIFPQPPSFQLRPRSKGFEIFRRCRRMAAHGIRDRGRQCFDPIMNMLTSIARPGRSFNIFRAGWRQKRQSRTGRIRCSGYFPAIPNVNSQCIFLPGKNQPGTDVKYQKQKNSPE